MNNKTMVFGASLKPNRYSNLAVKNLRNNNIEVVAFGLHSGEIDDVVIETELLPLKDIDTITLYMNAYRQSEFYDYFLLLNPRRIIFNPGTENPELWKLLKKHNIEFEVACTLTLLATNQY